MSSGRLQMSMLSGLGAGETEGGVVPSGLIMKVGTAPFSTSNLADKPSCLSETVKCDLDHLPVCQSCETNKQNKCDLSASLIQK